MTTSTFKLKALACLMFAFAANASAETYSNVPAGANTALPFAYFGNASNPSGDSPMVGQVFSLTSDSLLSSFSFYALGNTTASLQLNVAQWNPSTNVQNQSVNVVGSNLLSTTYTAVDKFNSAGNYTAISFGNLDLNLNANTKYIAYLTSSDSTVTGLQLSRTQTAADISGFGLGHAYLSSIPGQGWQLPFNGNGFLSLQYTAVTEVTAAVPEPETYAMLLAGLGLVGASTRRRKAKQA